jgi:hypothetical protein
MRKTLNPRQFLQKCCCKEKTLYTPLNICYYFEVEKFTGGGLNGS